MQDLGLLVFVGVAAVTLMVWFAPQVRICLRGNAGADGSSTKMPIQSSADGATAPSADTEMLASASTVSKPAGCCAPACCGCCVPISSRQRCFGIARFGTGCAGQLWSAACETVCILVVVYLALALVLFLAISVAKDSLTFANVKASACQSAPCTSSDPAACCSYAVESARFPGASAPLEVTYTTTDGLMHGWYMVNDTAPADGAAGWLTVLYSHGSGANVAVNYRQERYSWLLRQGRVRVFVYDYPGYGKSEGSPSYGGTQRAAVGAASWLQAKTNLSSDANVTYLGRSLGGNVAVEAIARGGGQSTRLVLQSTFGSWGSNFQALMPFLGWAMAPGFGGEFDANSAALDWSLRDNACVHQSHSKTDEWVPFSQGEALFKTIKPVVNPPGCASTFFEEDGPLHDDPLTPAAKASLGAWLKGARF